MRKFNETEKPMTTTVGRPAIGPKIEARLSDETATALQAYATEHGMSRADAVRDLLGRALQAAAPAPTDLPGRIRAAYDQIAGKPGRYVALVDLRAALADVDHDTLTRALHALHVEQDLTLTPEENRRSITPEDRAAAVVIGDEPRHLISYDR